MGYIYPVTKQTKHMVTYNANDVYAFVLASAYASTKSKFVHRFGPSLCGTADAQRVSLVDIEDWFTSTYPKADLRRFLRQMQSRVCGHIGVALEEQLPA